jgi:hypothetical protein
VWGWKWGWRMARITDVRARSIKPGDKPIADGAVPGLRLSPSKAKGHKKSWGYGKWILRLQSPVTNTRRDMGLGTYPSTTIAMARDLATGARRSIDNGLDPINEREAKRAAKVAARDAMTLSGSYGHAGMGASGGSNSPMAGPAAARHSDQAIPDRGNSCCAARSLPSEALPCARRVRIAGSWLARGERLDQSRTGSPLLATTATQWQARVNRSCLDPDLISQQATDLLKLTVSVRPGAAVRSRRR